MHARDCSCAPILRLFSAASDGPQQSAKFRPAFFGQFFTRLRKDSVANYASIWTLFSLTIRGLDVLCKALNVSQFRR